MAEARDRQLWAHTSSLLALVANVNRDVKKRPRPFKPADFNPHERKKGAKLGVAELKEMLEGEGK